MKIVVALGGNALGNSVSEQERILKSTVVPIVDLIAEGHDVVLAHGNGPQVGMIKLAMDVAEQNLGKEGVPITECGAMSQGYIGYHLQRFLRDELQRRQIEKEVVTIVTEVLVDSDDPAFANPRKPIGSFYSKEEADKLAAAGYPVMEDAGRGYRIVVASPLPQKIVQIKTIENLINAGELVITVGGGGIPVAIEDGVTVGKLAVIDKDFASAKLADQINADLLVILTAVEKVAINFGKENQEEISEMNYAEAAAYIESGEFAPGSMLPKIRAAMSFVEQNRDKRALITSLERAKEGFNGKTGTWIRYE
ncbi:MULTISPECIES: carbamate kinase [Ignatzschineria]|uniref:Carbamate kinase n=1 Tax=Ignatzschineria cameli TaxID=2182793 RepID=A0ABX5L260_9GAMM|nr:MULTISPECIES: carbamate kinase [Ignatzschineria]OYQ81493.1 carbamate kinase [Ignatzschineria sp. F8392]PWD92161.1 carbamate kinase [Ignatzschineria cameli]PWD93254.1 carbamate kinase [Ignatzschineria cameli]PWD93996.1 carbamate kinase [Ignatzschineria cameli]